MVLLYDECNQNATAVSKEYAARFPNRRHPDHHAILRLISRTRHTGSMNLTLKRVSGAPCRARVHLMEETVLEAVEQDPRSARVISCVVLQNSQPIELHRPAKQNFLIDVLILTTDFV
jgi:hypothetical protein